MTRLEAPLSRSYSTLRVGVVCEGATDGPAIASFLGASLAARGIVLTFEKIQPDPDGTNPTDGGWFAVLNWLLENSPKSRLENYLAGGLFGNGLSKKRCDVLVFQMDSDILSERGFQNWTRDTLGYGVMDSHDPIRRGSEIRSIIGIAGKFEKLSGEESKRHIPAPSVESTEAWCVAAYGRFAGDPEQLNGLNLCQEFMTALHLSEDRRLQPFRQIDKNPDRRRRYCERHADGFWRVETQCRHYRELVASVTSQVKSI